MSSSLEGDAFSDELGVAGASGGVVAEPKPCAVGSGGIGGGEYGCW